MVKILFHRVELPIWGKVEKCTLLLFLKVTLDLSANTLGAGSKNVMSASALSVPIISVITILYLDPIL